MKATITTTQYNQMFSKAESSSDFHELSDAINAMSTAERLVLQKQLLTEGCEKIMRNLFYNYQAQEWIE